MNDNARTPQTQQTAAQTYAARANDIARLIDVLQMELAKHALKAKDHPRDWGYAGDLGRTRSTLISTIEDISGLERQDVETFLSE